MGLGNAFSNQALYGSESEQNKSHLIVQAEQCYRDALSIRIKLHSDNHPLVADALEGVANMCCEKRKWTEAMEHYERSLAVRLKCFGPNHPLVAASYMNMSSVFFENKQVKKAMEFAKKCEAIKVGMCGANTISANDTDLGQLYYNISGLHYTLKEFTQALEYGERALSTYITAHGAAHPKSIQCREYLSILRENMLRMNMSATSSRDGDHEDEATLLAKAIALSLADADNKEKEKKKKKNEKNEKEIENGKEKEKGKEKGKKKDNKSTPSAKARAKGSGENAAKEAFARLFQEYVQAGMPPNEAAAKALKVLAASPNRMK